MLLKIQFFRCHENCTFEFLDSGVNLIAGDSGVGKTTILKALKWCLFGKIKSVANNAEVQLNPNYKPKTSVTLAWDKYNITRSKNPETIIFVRDGVKWESEVAQNLVNELFGTGKVWDATCNIDQNCLNSLITEPEKDKIDLLQSLSFNGDSPEVIKEKIAKAIEVTKEEFAKIQIDYGVEFQLYTTFMEEHKGKFHDRYYLQPKDETLLKDTISKHETEIADMNTKLIVFNKNLAIMETYEAQRKQFQEKLSLIQYIDLNSKKKDLTILETKVEEFKKFLIAYNAYLQQDAQIKIYQAKLDNLPFEVDLKTLKSEIEIKTSILQTLKAEVEKFKIQEFYYNELCKYKKLIAECNYYPNLLELETDLITLKNLKEAHKSRNEKLELREKLSAEKTNQNLQLSQIPNFDLNMLQQKINEYTEFLKYEAVSLSNTSYLNELNLLNSKIAELSIPSSIYYSRFTDQKLMSLEEQTSSYKFNSEFAKNLGIQYNAELINTEISSLKYILDLQPDIIKKITADDLKSKISVINVAPITKDQIYEARKKLEAMKSSNNILQCPHCLIALKLLNSQLIKSDQKSYTLEEINEYSKYVSQLEADELTYQKKTLLQWELDNLGAVKDVDISKKLTAEMYNSYNIKLSELQKLKIIDQPIYDLNLAKNAETYFKLQDKIKEISSKVIPGIPQYNNWDTLKADYVNLQETLKNAKNWDMYKTNLNLSLVELDKKLSDITIVELPNFDETELVKLENHIIHCKTENIKYQNLAGSIKEIETKAGTFEIVEKLRVAEAQTVELIETLRVINVNYMNAERFNNERQFITLELFKLKSIEYNFDKSLLGTTNDHVKDYENKINTLRAEISTIALNNSLWENYQVELTSLQQKIKSIDLDYSLTPKLQEYTSNLSKFKVMLEYHIINAQYKEKYSNLNKSRENVVEVQLRLADYIELQKHAIHVERECLEGTVAQINNDLSNICSTIFDSDIEVLLALYKPLKNEKEKESVNIHVLNKGIKYDFKELSGGQQSRVSLALTIALSLTSNSPVILLDEALASLDPTAREKCLKIIKHYTRKTVIMVNHDNIVSFYDNILQI